jgi:hypothetical protein
MGDQVGPEDAAQALAEIREHQRQVIDLASVPAWYWWTLAALMVGLSLTVDRAARHPLVVAVAVLAFVVGVLLATGRAVLGAWRRAQWRNDLLGSRGALAIVVFVGLAVGCTLGSAFALRAAGVAYPATLGSLLGGAVLVVGGPALTRMLRRIMLDNRAGGR